MHSHSQPNGPNTQRRSKSPESFDHIPKHLKSLAKCLLKAEESLAVVDGAFQRRWHLIANDPDCQAAETLYSEHTEVAGALCTVRAFTETLSSNCFDMRKYVESKQGKLKCVAHQATALPNRHMLLDSVIIEPCRIAHRDVSALTAELDLVAKRREIGQLHACIYGLRKALGKLRFDQFNEWGKHWFP